jgi:SAM-dependent methyltransferase
MHTINSDDARVECALRGETIYGDDFNGDEIDQWFRDEVKGYSSLDYVDSQTDHYAYRALNEAYAWKYLDSTDMDVLGFGSAFGSEFAQIASRISHLTIVEPEEEYWRTVVAGVATQYICPRPDGSLELRDNSFDMITAFGVLHHIPNVSHVFSELVRVLKPCGRLIIREPVVSMGDWRRPRRGLTARERGIPLESMRALIKKHRCRIDREQLIGFGPLLKIASMLKSSSHWNSRVFVWIDALFSAGFAPNYRYHRTKLAQRFAPTMGYWTIFKSATGTSDS